MLLYVVVGTCLMGGFAILLRITQERNRLLSRYLHIKKLLEYRENMRIHMEQKNQEIAKQEDFINTASPEIELEPGEEVATVQPVGEP